MRPKVAVLGHMVAAPNELEMPADRQQAQNLLQLHNFTRVVDERNKLVDHVQWLARTQPPWSTGPLSVWEIYLCAPILLASHLRRNGFDVELFNYIDSDNQDDVHRRLAQAKPDIIVLSSTFVLTKPHMVKFGRFARSAAPNAMVIAGGHHVFTTLMYMTPEQQDKYLEASSVDAFVNDTQGETALLKLCESFGGDLGAIPNVIWRGAGGAIHHNEQKTETNDINDTLLDFDDVAPGSIVHIRTARSCSFKCAFCSYPTIAGELALMDRPNVMETLRKAKKAGVSAIFFTDDTFNVPPDRFESLLDAMIEEKLDIPWYSFLRCQYVNEAVVQKMKRSGCAGVFLGIESGSDEILKNMKKGAVASFYRRGIKWLREAGIPAVGSFVIGFPGETAETVQETRELIEATGLEYCFLQPFYYLPHTPIYKRAAEFGLVGHGLTWSHNTMRWDEALNHLSRLFFELEGTTTFVHPDYNLWEIAYLRGKGMSLDDYKAYRKQINAMTRAQMERFGAFSSPVTSRSS
jgi:p-methyltransferase